MQFGHTILYVTDVAQTVEFYQKAFGFAIAFADPSGGYTELDTGTTKLAIAAQGLGEANLGGAFLALAPTQAPVPVVLSLLPDEVNAAYQQAVTAGATSVAAPERKPWGQELALVRDPNGVLIQLAKWVGDAS